MALQVEVHEWEEEEALIETSFGTVSVFLVQHG
jgi:hypothetical protein